MVDGDAWIGQISPHDVEQDDGRMRRAFIHQAIIGGGGYAVIESTLRTLCTDPVPSCSRRASLSAESTNRSNQSIDLGDVGLTVYTHMTTYRSRL